MTESAEKYLLRVTAGPSYDEATHIVLPVNTEKPTTIAGDHCTTRLNVRVQNFRGLPHGLPSTSPYFSHAPHTYDQYSIEFTFTPHQSVSGNALVWGNDFDRPVRDRLPPGFGTAFKIVKWVVDPGLDGDVYADKPYLYGPALSSLNVIRVGPKATRGEKGGWELPANPSSSEEQTDEHPNDDEDKAKDFHAFEEGAEDEEGHEQRKISGLPDDAAARKKWALYEEHRGRWEWEAGRTYTADFFNPYLDFNTFSVKLPGFTLCVLPYLDGKDSLRRNHDLRYVLKDKETGHVYFVVLFTLVLKTDAEEQEAKDPTEGESVNKGAAENSNSAATGVNPQDDDLD